MKAVLFDLGGTLVRTAPVHEIFRRILALHGIEKPSAVIDLAVKKVNEQMSLESYTLSYDEFWRLYNLEILKRTGLQRNLRELADAINEEWWDNADVELFPDVKETLRTLKQRGFKIGIVTNGFQLDIEEILSRTSLTGQFDVAVGVDDVGRPKPYKEMFLCAVEKLGVSPQEVLFAGDNPKIDYEGAKAAGLKPILIDRTGEPNSTSLKMTKVRDLREVLSYL